MPKFQSTCNAAPAVAAAATSSEDKVVVSPCDSVILMFELQIVEKCSYNNLLHTRDNIVTVNVKTERFISGTTAWFYCDKFCQNFLRYH